VWLSHGGRRSTFARLPRLPLCDHSPKEKNLRPDLECPNHETGPGRKARYASQNLVSARLTASGDNPMMRQQNRFGMESHDLDP